MLKIIQNSKKWFGLSIFFIVLSLSSMIFSKITNGYFLNFGIDFKGGSFFELQFEKEIKKENLEKFLEEKYFTFYPKVSKTGEKNVFVKLRFLNDKEHKAILKEIKGKFGKFEEVKFTTIGPSVGAELKKNALIAVIVALFAIIIYIAFAFSNLPQELSSFKFGFATIGALVHDIIVTIGAFSFLGLISGIEIDGLFITALLTVMGFSVHDTIVVFDRIRENLHKKNQSENFADISNKAVNQTLRRSINTSISTLFPLIALYFFGAQSIELFVFALIVGITIGTYSSIFLATPLLVAISHKGELTERKKSSSI